MKKFLIHLLFFFIIVSIIDIIFGITLDYMRTHAKGGETKQFYDVCLIDQYDVIVMGSSRARHHYDNKIIEDSLMMSCYNAGVDGNGIILGYGIYQMITNRYSPKKIIYDIEQAFDIYEYKQDNNRIRYIALLRPYYKEPGIREIIESISPEEHLKLNSAFYRYNSCFVSVVRDFFTLKDVSSNGYLPLEGVMLDSVFVAQKWIEDTPYDENKLGYLRKLVEDTQQKGIDLLLVASPKYGAVGVEDFVRVKEMCENNKALFIDDLYDNDDFMCHPEFFKDNMHLNGQGAHIYTIKLLQYFR